MPSDRPEKPKQQLNVKESLLVHKDKIR